jgi:single-strand DNA-binding protein
MGEYLKKGHRVYLEGRLQTRSWEDSNGVKKWTTEVVASDMEMLEAKPSGAGAAPAAGTEEAPPVVDIPDAEPAEDLPF